MDNITKHIENIPHIKGMTDKETKEFKESVIAYAKRYITNLQKFKLRKWGQ